MKLKTTFLTLLAVITTSVTYAEKLTSEQYTSKLTSMAMALKSAQNQANTSDMSVFIPQTCRKVRIHREVLKMAKDNPQFPESEGLKFTAQDQLQQISEYVTHLTGNNGQKPLTVDEFCSAKYNF